MQSQTILRPGPRPPALGAGPASLQAAVDRVARDGRDVICTAVMRMRTGPLPALLGGTTAFPQVLWHEARGDGLYAGLGAVVALETRHPQDLPYLVGRCQAVAERHPGPDTGLHRIFGGFAFDGSAPVNPRWAQGWPARFFLPEISLRQTPADGDEADVAIRVKVLEGMTAAEVERRVLDLAGQLEDWRDAGAIAARARKRAHGVSGMPAWRRPHPRQGRDRWMAAVERIRREIALGGLSKLVLSRDIDLVPDFQPDPGDVFEAMTAGCPGTYRFLFRFDDSGAFMGASPERLVALAGDRLDVSCLAGTAPRGASPEEDVARAAALRASPKDAAEHDLVVEAVLARLQPFCEPAEVPERPELVALPTVFHLHTPVRARLAGRTGLGPLLAALHPTPAVAGLPARDARGLIRLLEGRPRGWYGGAVGWIGADSAELAVAIRCMTLHPDGATLTVGAGIVEGSDPQGEWDETECKAASLLGVLGVARP